MREPWQQRRTLVATFYRRPTEIVARSLLGKVLIHRDRAGVIVETEAYLDERDLASHARFGRTGRNAVMFGPGGVSYVYLCYGMHHMFNVVTERDGVAGAVLIRALLPVGGMRVEPARCDGPGKLSRALELTRDHSGVELHSSRTLRITRGPHRVRDDQIIVGPRVGIDYAREWIDAPLRFRVRGPGSR